jgi:DNA-binding CsgD family transcriptional regulator
MGGVAFVSAGSYHTLILKSDSTLWDRNRRGSCGHGASLAWAGRRRYYGAELNLSGSPMTEKRLPWRKVLSFLEAVESERTWQGLFARVLQQLESSVPFDYGLAVLVTGHRQVDRQEILVSHIDDTVLNQYFGHYISVDPVLPLIPVLPGVMRVNWTDFRDTEYITDFLRPTGALYSIGLNSLNPRTSTGLWIALHKGGHSQYSDLEAAFAGTVLPHLQNLLLASVDREEWRVRSIRRKGVQYGLTPQEVRIAIFLCDRMSSKEIGDRLFISPRTAERHIDHIFAKLGANKRQEARGLLFAEDPPPSLPLGARYPQLGEARAHSFSITRDENLGTTIRPMPDQR